MKLKRKTLIALGTCAALIGAVVAVGASARNSIEEAAAPKPALTVSTDVPLQMNLPVTLAANGSVLAWQEASIGAEANGLRLSEVRVNVGDTVRKGEVLARFAPETVSAELQQTLATVAEAEAAAAEAAANAERARGLQKTGALSEQQITQYLTTEQTARARLKAQSAAAEAQRLRLSKTEVLAPDDGVISARTATVGAVVPAGQELFRMIRQSRLEWRAEVTSSELPQLSAGAKASLVAPNGTRVSGTVRMVAPTVDPQTRLGIVYVDLPRGTALKAGMFARGVFDLGNSMALTVPQQSVVVRDGFSYVFRLVADNRVEQTKVRTGRRTADRVEVLDLDDDARLVAAGAGFLNDGDLVRLADARKPASHASEVAKSNEYTLLSRNAS